ncbi:MAG: UDP-N-acetyl glucosamine 2-epimerase [Candidatus Pelagibacter sp.]
MRYKLITVVGTRPELIRLSEIIKDLDKNFHHKLIHTNQNFDKNLKDVFFKDLKINKPKYDLKIKSSNSMSTVAQILIKMDAILKKEKPDAFFILGDTNSALSSIAAKKNKIPIFHYEAGNRCFDQRVPEEINRRIVDHISDVNLTYSEFAKDNLLREGLPPDRTFNIGSPLGKLLRKIIRKLMKVKFSKIKCKKK